MSFFGTIFVVLLVLKLLGMTQMSWWLVFAPLWVTWLVLLIAGFLGVTISSRKGKK